MTHSHHILQQQMKQRFGDQLTSIVVDFDEVTVEIPIQNFREICFALRDESPFKFNLLVDVCGVDYLYYGVTEWNTHASTLTGFSRAVDPTKSQHSFSWTKPRFAVVYHLLSLSLNQRVRLKVFLDDHTPTVDSVVDIWASAHWFEREAFDLFGILFKGNPDLRRILTDYGFIGHPFRKDFPLIGQVEMRYDAATQRCVYEPVSIQSRTLVPKVIRNDHLNSDSECKDNLKNV